VSSVDAGYAYLGQARAAMELSDLCFALREPSHKKPPEFNVSAALETLQQRVNELFVPPASIEKHSDFIRLNATLKQATELETANLHAGAYYQYLRAVLQTNALLPHTKEIPQDSLHKKLAAHKRELMASAKDDSIAELFLQRAETLLDDTDPASATSAELILDQVLPAFRQAQTAVASTRAQPHDVTVTLVRWPYT
jgi:hypothetical protein